MSRNGASYSGSPGRLRRMTLPVDAYHSPSAGGRYSGAAIPGGASKPEKRKPLPSFYNHYGTWIIEPRMSGVGGPPPSKKPQGTGGKTPGGVKGGGYAPGNPFPVR